MGDGQYKDVVMFPYRGNSNLLQYVFISRERCR
jgi:hypothetical protein